MHQTNGWDRHSLCTFQHFALHCQVDVLYRHKIKHTILLNPHMILGQSQIQARHSFDKTKNQIIYPAMCLLALSPRLFFLHIFSILRKSRESIIIQIMILKLDISFFQTFLPSEYCYQSTKIDTSSKEYQQYLNMLKFVLVALALTLIVAQDPCEPFGLRIYYGDVVTDQNSPQRLVFYFNTKLDCLDSYVSVISVLGYKKIPCVTKAIETSAFMDNYIAYIHVCPTADVPFEQAISYTAYGWSADSQINATPFKEQWIDIKIIDPRVTSRSLKMVVLADWGTIETNAMTPITDDLKRLVSNNEINAVMVAGDIAYDLDSFNGRVYEDFLLLMQEFSPRLPFFMTPGNHERRTVDAALLFNETFKVYGVDKTLATGIYFGSVFLTMFDPFNVIYSKPEPISSLDALKTQLLKGFQSGRFIIPYSHYPLQCSGQFEQCSDGFNKLKPYFDAMFDNGVSLYIGAHSHVYERTYPYFRDGTFGTQVPPYVSGQYIISVVEGVSGNNRSIIPSMPIVQPFTAKYTVNETGFAVIESTPGYVTFEHISTKQGSMDKFTINLPFAGKETTQKKELTEEPMLRFETQ